jgi:hypothetical protein
MLSAVWVAVVVAVAFWVVAVCVAVFVMIRAARLISETTAAVRGLRERGDAVMAAASAATEAATEQIARTAAITASMEEVSATMAELNGRLTALAPAARTIAGGIAVPLNRAAALVYGVGRAVGMRRRGRPALARPVPQARAQAVRGAQPARGVRQGRVLQALGGRHGTGQHGNGQHGNGGGSGDGARP